MRFTPLVLVVLFFFFFSYIQYSYVPGFPAVQTETRLCSCMTIIWSHLLNSSPMLSLSRRPPLWRRAGSASRFAGQRDLPLRPSGRLQWRPGSRSLALQRRPHRHEGRSQGNWSSHCSACARRGQWNVIIEADPIMLGGGEKRDLQPTFKHLE